MFLINVTLLLFLFIYLFIYLYKINCYHYTLLQIMKTFQLSFKMQSLCIFFLKTVNDISKSLHSILHELFFTIYIFLLEEIQCKI